MWAPLRDPLPHSVCHPRPVMGCPLCPGFPVEEYEELYRRTYGAWPWDDESR